MALRLDQVWRVARTPPLAMMRNSNQAVPQGQSQPSSPDIKRIEYERQNQPDWERRLGPVRVRTIKASLPEGSTDTDYLTARGPAIGTLFDTAGLRAARRPYAS